MRPLQQDLCILEGADWRPVIQWLSEDATHKQITDVETGLPTLVTVPMHGLDVDARLPVWITNVQGPRVLNTADYRDADPRWAVVLDDATLAVDFDSGAQSAYQRGGVLTWYAPVDLFNWSARQEIRAGIDATQVLSLLTTENGGIALGVDGSIARHMTAEATRTIGRRGVYRLELTDPRGIVYRFAEGAVRVSPDFEPATP